MLASDLPGLADPAAARVDHRVISVPTFRPTAFAERNSERVIAGLDANRLLPDHRLAARSKAA